MRCEPYFDEPIAIIGMACRFPGANDIESFWHFLEAGKNAIVEGLPGSGVGRIGALYPEPVESPACRFGAFVDGIDQFDAEFFRISPAEAELMDPQQRMLLETSWLALEDAGIDPAKLRGSRTGTYVGITHLEYRGLVLQSGGPAGPASLLQALTGTNMNTAAGRVSFALGLEGPNFAVDTACSSSLVSIHLAVVGLQRGESDLALAGGVQAIIDGQTFEYRALCGMLSPDGQCKAFDASGNGFVRGEGCGIVVLKRLSDAEADGDRIWGVIRGSAINHDGAGAGMSAPNGLSQQRVIREAISRAGVSPADVDYLEAHGTGTVVGDPVELNAAAEVYGQGRGPDGPLLVGSVKTNIGHLESAAGIAGLIKAVLAMKRGVIPKHLHFNNPNPRIDWENLPVRVTTEATEWPVRSGRPPLAGVSAYGMSGTNAHLVVEGYGSSNSAVDGVDAQHWFSGPALKVPVSLPEKLQELPQADGTPAERDTRFLPLSGRSEDALRELAQHYQRWLDGRLGESRRTDEETLLADMAWTASVGRSHFLHRAALVFDSAHSLRKQLRELSEAVQASEARTSSKVAFLYTGQGSQWVGMGQALYESEPVVRAVLDRCEAAFQKERGASLLDVMFGRDGAEGDLESTDWAQPALYALESALTALWASVGIRPDVVAGHSLGEIPAAHAAGAFSLEDGMRFVAVRGTLMAGLSEGAMAVIFAPRDQVAAAVDQLNAATGGLELSLAVDNGTQQVISGPPDKVRAIAEEFEREGFRVRELSSQYAFHSALVEPILDPQEEMLNGLDISPLTTHLVSNVTGLAVEPGETLDPAYWRLHTRMPVAFAESIRTLAGMDVDIVVEIGPHAVLGPLASLNWPQESAGGSGRQPAVLPSMLRPSRGDTGTTSGFVEAAAGAYQAGLDIRFEGMFAGEERRRISIPDYPFQRRRFWYESPKRRRQDAGHPLLGVRHNSPRGQVSFETDLSASDPAWIGDHRVFGRVVAPGALYGAMATSAVFADGAGMAIAEDFQLHSPLILPDDGHEDESEGGYRQLQTVLDAPDETGARRMEIFSKGNQDSWVLHVTGKLRSTGQAAEAGAREDLESLKSGLTPQDVSDLFRAKSATGIDFGPAFRALEAVWSGEGEAVGEVALPPGVDRDGVDVHPVLLDGCFQVMSAARGAIGGENSTAYMPFGWERMWLSEPLPDRIFCHVQLRESTGTDGNTSEPPEVQTADLWLYDSEGNAIGGLAGFVSKRATRTALLSAVEGLDDLFYEIEWRDRPLAGGKEPADFLTSPAEVATQVGALSAYLSAEGVTAEEDADFMAGLERLAQSYALNALDELGWIRVPGAAVDPDALLKDLRILRGHRRLLGRMLEMLCEAGVLSRGTDGGLLVAVAAPEPTSHDPLENTDELATELREKYPFGASELALLCKCGSVLPEVLEGSVNPLDLLFSEAGPNAADVYQNTALARASTRMVGDAIAATLSRLPEGRRLKVIEIGAGTGSGTAAVLPVLPEGQVDYLFTDISASFFSNAERRFENCGTPIEFRALNIEQDPAAQGFDRHSYDMVIAVNVLHATRNLGTSLANCRELLAPSGQLVVLEILQNRGWRDLVFGLLEGWWRFDDDYRTDRALAGPAAWRRAFSESGFSELEFVGAPIQGNADALERGVLLARSPAVVTEPEGLWILAVDGQGAAADIAEVLASRNQRVVLATDAAATEVKLPDSNGIFFATVEADQRESWRLLLKGLPSNLPLTGIVHLMGMDGHGPQASAEDMKQDVTRAAASALALTQGLIDADAAPTLGIWFVTKGAQALQDSASGELAGATLWGIGNVINRESAALKARMIDLDPSASTLPDSFIDELLFPDKEVHIAYRGGNRRVARMVRSGRQTPTSDLQYKRVRNDRTYLVTGGLGGIGCAVAEWLAEQGAGAIVLNGRRPPDATAENTIAMLRERGANVHVELADVTNDRAVEGMLVRINETLPPLGGVIHSVGTLSDASLANQSWTQFEALLWPKVVGAWRLHKATENLDLDLFVLFSSIAGIKGNPGQANHAAANTFLDQLAGHRRALGLAGQVIQWGAWQGVGEAEEHRERIAESLASLGSGWFTPRQGIQALDRVVRENSTSVMVTVMDWPVHAASLPRPLPLIEDLLPAVPHGLRETRDDSDELLSRLLDAPVEEREQILVSFIQGLLRSVLRLPSIPSPSVKFFELGVDSLMAVDLRNRLNRVFLTEYVVPSTVVFDFPDTISLARHLLGELGKADGVALAPQRQLPKRTPPSAHDDGGIAIVGMACRFPGAPDLAAYWRLLENGANAITDGRPDAADLNGVASGISAGIHPFQRGGYISGIEEFDAPFFRIAPIEAQNMDPQQRLLLETSWHALEDAGMNPERLKNSRTGVYAGIIGSEYRELARSTGNNVGFMSNNGGMAVGRVAYELGLAGPAMPVELACASALAAVHQGVAGLRQGEVDLALVGGVNAVLSPAVTMEMALAGMLSPDGRCSTFDSSANGYVRGEGCGMVVLKRLSEAEADGDRIWGVIRGSAVNQNGVSAGPTAPNGPAQQRVIQEALSRSGISPREVDYLEAHGVGSGFGDPIEVQAAATVYGEEREAERPLLIGSVKTNIGHLEAAAGAAALIKAVLAMKRGVIPKHLNFQEPTPLLDWEKLPVQVTSEATVWPGHPGRHPLAGVSAFGMQGTNAHVIVEGYEVPAGEYGGVDMARDLQFAGSGRRVEVSLPEPLAYLPLAKEGLAARETRLLPLSGKSDAALRELAERYLSLLDDLIRGPLEDHSAASMLADVAWTASVGRGHFAYRAGLVFGDAGKLREELKTLIEAESRPEAREISKVGFVYAELGNSWVGTGRELYESEPVARAVFDRCEAVYVEEKGSSLLEGMFRGALSEGNVSELDWERPAFYALECALTALWHSLGVRPATVAGRDDGKLAAAQAVGLLSLEEGLRLAASGATSPILERVPTNVTEGEPGVDLVVEIRPDRGFTGSVASAYEAGLDIDFCALFAGETRRRISVPDYPFQRRSYWFEMPTRTEDPQNG